MRRNLIEARAPNALLLELKSNELGRLFWGRFKLPLFDGIEASLYQHRIAAHGTRGFHVAIGRDHNFDSYLADNAHATSKIWIGWIHPVLDLALSFFDRRLLRASQ